MLHCSNGCSLSVYTFNQGKAYCLLLDFSVHCLCQVVFADLILCPVYIRLKEEDKICVSTDGPFESVLKFKPPMCFSMEDADLVAKCIDRILTGWLHI